ncbi:MAG: serine/threonine-protein kinase [Myxococcaceae bacterium]
MRTLEMPKAGEKEVLVLGGRFRVLSHLGGGGMSEVYLAEQLSLGRKVALKVLKRDLGKQPAMAERFKREAMLLSTVEHPAVVRVIDFESSPEATVLVLELAEGETLERVLKQGPLSPARAVPVLAQIAEGLGAIHEKGVIHRDIKPQNVVLTPTNRGEQARLLDFGIARLMEIPEREETSGEHVGSPFVSHPGQVVGTPAYVAPEQATASDLDARTDVYSFGVLAYRTLSGQFPFVGPGSNDFLKQHLTVPPRPLDDAFPGLRERPELVRLVMQCLEKKPDDRPANGQALLTALLPMMPVNPYESSVTTPSRRVLSAVPSVPSMPMQATPVPADIEAPEASPPSLKVPAPLKTVTEKTAALTSVSLQTARKAVSLAARVDTRWRRSLLWAVLIMLVPPAVWAMWPPSPLERAAAMIEKGKAGDALPVLDKRLETNPADAPEVYALKVAAFHALGKHTDERGVLRDVPYEALHSAHPLMLEAVAQDFGADEDDRELRALISLVPHEALQPAFTKMAKAGRSKQQWGALRFLDVTSLSQNLDRVELYAKSLSDPDCTVRSKAAGRLAELGDDDAIAPLRDLSETPKEETSGQKVDCGQDEAAEAIRQLKKR